MSQTDSRPAPRLSGRRIAILMESDFVEDEIAYYRRRFLEEGAEVSLVTRLWGQSAQTFTGHEHQAPLTVDGDLEALDYGALCRLSALIVPSGMVADRLRYSEDIARPAPALDLMRKAFRLPKLVKAFSCHGLWLVSAAPELVRNRPVTCHNNLVGDVRNMGAVYADEDVVSDGDLVTGRTVEHCHLLARAVIDALAGEGSAEQTAAVRAAGDAPAPESGAPADGAAGPRPRPQAVPQPMAVPAAAQVPAPVPGPRSAGVPEAV